MTDKQRCEAKAAGAKDVRGWAICKFAVRVFCRVCKVCNLRSERRARVGGWQCQGQKQMGLKKRLSPESSFVCEVRECVGACFITLIMLLSFGFGIFGTS
jgi:hypothetical protein